jgi:phosphoglucosamine mutase
MVEADDVALRDHIADDLVQVLITQLGGHIHGRVDLTYALGD